MDSNESTYSQSVDRRSFIKRAVASGSVTSIAGLPKVTARRDSINVPIVKRRDEIIAEKNVSRRWWEHVKKSRQARGRIQKQFGTKRQVKGIKTTLSKDTIHNQQKLKISVELSQDTDLRKRDLDIPNRVDDVMIEVAEAEEQSPTVCENKGTYDYVFGGYTFGYNSNGTAGWRVYLDGNRYVLTAAHLFSSEDPCGGFLYTDVHQGDQKFGQTTVHFDSKRDYMLVEKTTDNPNIGDQVVHQGNQYKMLGHTTNNEVLMEDQETVYKSGKTSGYTTGNITSINVYSDVPDSCIDLNGNAIEYSNMQADGDSGCAPFVLTDSLYGEVAAVTGLATVGRSPDGTIYCDNNSYDLYDSAVGVSAEQISSTRDIYYG